MLAATKSAGLASVAHKCRGQIELLCWPCVINSQSIQYYRTGCENQCGNILLSSLAIFYFRSPLSYSEPRAAKQSNDPAITIDNNIITAI